MKYRITIVYDDYTAVTHIFKISALDRPLDIMVHIMNQYIAGKHRLISLTLTECE